MKLIKPNPQPTTLAGFSRASTATYIDDAGVLQTAGVDVPRWQGGQLLVEGAGGNLIPNSQNFGAWPAIGFANMTVTTDVADPFGGTAAALLTATSNNGLFQQAVVVTAGVTLTGSFWIRRHTGSGTVSFRVGDGNSFAVPVTSTWRRLSITAVATTTTGRIGVVLSVSGDAVEIFGAQLEVGSAMTSYIPTTTAPVTRAADIITGVGLLSTTATDATPDYNPVTTYLAGVQVQYNRVRYQSLQASNTGRTPDVNPTWWARLGPVNQWAMFDDQVSTQTLQTAGPLRVALQTGAMDSLAVLGVDADRVRLVVQDGAGGPVVYDQEQGMAAEAVTNWFDYFFNDPTYRRTQALFSGIPPFGGSVATLTFASGSPVRVGHVSYGRVRSLGGLRYGARAGIKDFSRKDTDEFGATTFVRRANSKYLTGTLEVEKFAINQVHNLLTSLTATPVVWIGSDDVYYSDTLLVFGFFRDFYCSIDYPTLAIYSLEIEGLT